MDWMSVYTSREGRISRKTWWLATIAMVVVAIILEIIVVSIVSVRLAPNSPALTDPNSADAAALMADTIRKSAWLSLIFFVVFFVPIMTLGLKRRHDCNSNGRDLIIYLVLTVVMMLIQALGIGAGTKTVATVEIPTPGLIVTVLTFIVAIYGMYLLVMMGFLKGTAGPNDYGPDPLGGSAAVAA